MVSREQQPSPEPFAVSIHEAARIVGMSRSQFYRVYLEPQRIRPIPNGRRRQMIDMEELRRAYAEYKAETRADE